MTATGVIAEVLSGQPVVMQWATMQRDGFAARLADCPYSSGGADEAWPQCLEVASGVGVDPSEADLWGCEVPGIASFANRFITSLECEPFQCESPFLHRAECDAEEPPSALMPVRPFCPECRCRLTALGWLMTGAGSLAGFVSALAAFAKLYGAHGCFRRSVDACIAPFRACASMTFGFVCRKCRRRQDEQMNQMNVSLAPA